LFPIVGFLARRILRIIGSQKETKRIFSLARIFTNFKRCLQSENLEKLIFVNENWLNDVGVACKSLSDLVKFIEMAKQLTKELHEFENEFE
jgi:glutamyl/glutaminyl-tRNA synthetase